MLTRIKVDAVSTQAWPRRLPLTQQLPFYRRGPASCSLWPLRAKTEPSAIGAFDLAV
jgi:hypothetical protein